MIVSVNASLHNIVKGSALIFFGMVASLLLWFATKILIIRNCTKEELGVYSLAVAIISIFALLSNLGLQEGVSRYISIYLGEGKKDNALGISRDAFFMGALSSVAVLAVVFFSSGIISKYIFYKPELEMPLKVMSLFIPFSVMANIANGILRGHNIIQPKVFMDVGQPFLFLVFLGLFALFGLSFISIIYAYVFAIAVIFFAMTAYTFNKIRVNIRESVWSNKGELLRFSLPLMVASMSGLVLNWTDTLILGRYTTPGEVGIYNAGLSLARLLFFMMGACGFIYLPMAGEMHARGRVQELKRTYQVLTKWVFTATLPIFFILFFFPEMILTFLYGQKMLSASRPLSILSAAFLFSVFLGANGVMLTAIGKTKAIMNTTFASGMLNIALNYIFIKRFGMGATGAALATMIAFIVQNSAVSAILYRQSGIHPFTRKYLKPLLSISIVGLAIYAIAKSLPLHMWMLPIYFILFLTGYLVSLFANRGIDDEDIYFFEAVTDRIGLKMEFLNKLLRRFSV
jgi:O-antigen/teichoic acid export membrane protein